MRNKILLVTVDCDTESDSVHTQYFVVIFKTTTAVLFNILCT